MTTKTRFIQHRGTTIRQYVAIHGHRMHCTVSVVGAASIPFPPMRTEWRWPFDADLTALWLDLATDKARRAIDFATVTAMVD